jgi:hypothetical protein
VAAAYGLVIEEGVLVANAVTALGIPRHPEALELLRRVAH